MTKVISEVIREGKHYVGYHLGKEVTRKLTEYKATEALYKYVKGQTK